ncbi:tektin-2 [Anolis carolinensis]|uniref:tektin-2 n=1 Tax=Anolis carolinensis TaxID=28377 RepID=UPI000462CDC2|nr:PREDICTED: tektin-2 [Anolis carolinensis]XP_016852916.1 PREDICTED: tektin-2 [Anolis carolinensis]XP_016852917.1 PREDICTED: tektin-2 [Anolis carolinensis]XP_016852918.1 PREDICTED: tektin-2 [Anolis carolinensis]XP_016852919.1 PREDICTED: tektin-2 [Anolis carolinensis]XP_016852920.1 PREDICTED: tektin-2 [Anolis carolinensis]|eukprot:XP_003227506.2 PREDICTED: tektin-2 [Anolis carolinensis]
MATLSMKPGQRFTFPDWRMNRELLVSNAERQRIASHQIRQEARALRNETNNQTIWDEHDNRTRLNERIDCVNRLKEMLDKCLTNIDIEISSLTQMKEKAERALQAKNLPLDVAIENLTLRESRRGIDVVKDPVEDELHKEVEVIDATRRDLQQKVSEAFEQLCLLQEARQQLNLDHRGKMEALEIDRTCVSLNIHSPNISYKVNPTRVPNESLSPEQWDQCSQYNKERGEAEVKASYELREAIALTIAQTDNELEAQRVATEFAFRKRVHELERALDELRWGEKNTMEEIAEMEDDIRRLEEDLRIKVWNLKLAHTRLETRTYRPNLELCRDQAQHGLTDEVHQLEGTIAILKQKLAQAQDALDALQKQLYRIQTDIAVKANSLLLDNKCLDTRRKLTVPGEKFVPEVDTFNRTTNRTLSPLKSRQLELA